MCLGWYPDVVWVKSYINRARNLVTCIYLAESEAAIREHAVSAALPVTGIWPVEEVSPDEIAAPAQADAERYARALGMPPLPAR